MQMSFGTLELAQRLRRNSAPIKIDILIDWEELRSKRSCWDSGIVCRIIRWSIESL